MRNSNLAKTRCYIFYSSLEKVIFLNNLKYEVITPIKKKHLKRQVGNYRIVSVLPVISKIFEKIV